MDLTIFYIVRGLGGGCKTGPETCKTEMKNPEKPRNPV
jgi:hypothetical protein